MINIYNYCCLLLKFINSRPNTIVTFIGVCNFIVAFFKYIMIHCPSKTNYGYKNCRPSNCSIESRFDDQQGIVKIDKLLHVYKSIYYGHLWINSM